jgi:transcriptional regulator with XRE-family HTH domain
MATKQPSAAAASIREARELRKLTQKQLAVKLGVSERTVRGWESSTTVPRSRRYALAAELHLPNLVEMLAGSKLDHPELWQSRNFYVAYGRDDEELIAKLHALRGQVEAIRMNLDDLLAAAIQASQHRRRPVNGQETPEMP